MTVHGKDFNMQVSSWGTICGIVGDKCTAGSCDVPARLTTTFGGSDALNPIEKPFKDFKDDIEGLTGFRMERFEGAYVD